MNTAVQMKICQHAGNGNAAGMRRLQQRQARVGIIANTVEMDLPAPPPKDVWLRWPRLRSSRRLKHGAKLSQDMVPGHDEILSGELLDNFKNDLRVALGAKRRDSAYDQRLPTAARVDEKVAKSDRYEGNSSEKNSMLAEMAEVAKGVTSFWQRLK